MDDVGLVRLEFQFNFGSSLVESLMLWVGLGRVTKIAPSRVVRAVSDGVRFRNSVQHRRPAIREHLLSDAVRDV